MSQRDVAGAGIYKYIEALSTLQPNHSKADQLVAGHNPAYMRTVVLTTGKS